MPGFGPWAVSYTPSLISNAFTSPRLPPGTSGMKLMNPAGTGCPLNVTFPDRLAVSRFAWPHPPDTSTAAASNPARTPNRAMSMLRRKSPPAGRVGFWGSGSVPIVRGDQPVVGVAHDLPGVRADARLNGPHTAVRQP